MGKFSFIFFIVGILSCIAAIAADSAIAYILCFKVLITAILFGLLLLLANIIWYILPRNLKCTYKGKKNIYNRIVVFSTLFFYIVGKFVYKICLPEASGIVSSIGIVTTFVFAIFFIWSMINRNNKRTIIIPCIGFILFIALLSFVNSITIESNGNPDAGNLEILKSLPYVGWSPAENEIEKVGVLHYDRNLAFDGLNLHQSLYMPEASLIDMNGNVVHKWFFTPKDRTYISKLCKNGNLLVGVRDGMLILMDWYSNIKWMKELRLHHEITVDKTDMIYILSREENLMFWHGIPVPILCDYIKVLSMDGELKRTINIYDLVKEWVSLPQIIDIYKEIISLIKPRTLVRFLRTRATLGFFLEHDTAYDILHTNQIDIIERDIPDFCNKGDILISVRELDLIGIVDSNREEFKWHWGPGHLSKQHCPALLENGNVLIFDNGIDRGISRIIELNPLSKKIEWAYQSDPPEKFFSEWGGACQRLPNGNTLITDSVHGHVFEINGEGKIVWELYNPDINRETQKRRTINGMERIIDSEIIKQIKSLKSNSRRQLATD